MEFMQKKNSGSFLLLLCYLDNIQTIQEATRYQDEWWTTNFQIDGSRDLGVFLEQSHLPALDNLPYQEIYVNQKQISALFDPLSLGVLITVA